MLQHGNGRCAYRIARGTSVPGIPRARAPIPIPPAAVGGTLPATPEIVPRLHLRWSCQIVKMSQKQLEITDPAGRFSIQFFGKDTLSTVHLWFCSEFGKKVSNQALAFSGSGVQAGFWIESN